MLYVRNKHGSRVFLVVLLTDNQVVEPVHHYQFLAYSCMLRSVGPRFLNAICKELLSHERLIRQTVKADPLKFLGLVLCICTESETKNRDEAEKTLCQEQK